MVNELKLKMDTGEIERKLEAYTGTEACHFAVIGGKNFRDQMIRQFMVGGNTQMIATLLAEGLARIVDITPGLDETFFVSVCQASSKILQDIRKEKKKQ